jgi:TonB-linked SusC/RagA family outer membrane protein
MKRYIIMLLSLLAVTTGALAQSEMEITGKVTDPTGEELIGVSVVVKDVKGLGVITDIEGNYKIKVRQYQTLVFSYIGYKPQEVLVKGDRQVINVTLEEDTKNAVDEVVVTGMGTQKKLTVTGAVTNVNMGDLKHYSSSNLSNTLAGNVPGIIAMQTSGQPGRNTSEFWIRGISTFGAGSKAYILVDGFERDNINDLNIEDIESFSVLKDASATAIYGSKGANGVILVTTKTGSKGAPKMKLSVDYGLSNPETLPEYIDAGRIAEMANIARKNEQSFSALFSDAEIAAWKNGTNPLRYPSNDWFRSLLKDFCED